MQYTKEWAEAKIASGLGMSIDEIPSTPNDLRHLRDILTREHTEYSEEIDLAIQHKYDRFAIRRLLCKQMDASTLLDAVNTLLK